MTHLTTDELVDAVEGTLEPSRQTHLDACPPCRQQVTALGRVLAETRAVDMPEPSPLYWQHLSDRVRTAIDAEPAAAAGWGGWLRWPVLAPFAALVLVVMALAVSLPREPRDVPARAAADAVGVDEAPPDERFAIVADMVGDMDWDTAMSAGFAVKPGAADLAVLELTAAEQQELTRLLKELTSSKS
ncbi:MAG: hypothetical protein AB7P34_11175 [Vicinamibacterales bacterium]